MRAAYKDRWQQEAAGALRGRRTVSDDRGAPGLDSYALLTIMWEYWNPVFAAKLKQAERSLVSELRDIRNRWAHQNPFSMDDTYRALDSAQRLLTAASAPEAAE